MKDNVFRFLIMALATLLVPDFADAQVHGSGPSDSSDFDLVIDIPPEPNIGFSEARGGDGLTTQINVGDGGDVGGLFDAFSGSEVNISGGNVDNVFRANSGSEVNISGGNVGPFFGARSGSEVNISGGNVGFDFNAESGSDVELFGGEFELNGVAFTESTITLGSSDVLTGTLTDGSAFIFSSQTFDNLNNVTLTPTSLPVIDATPIVINTAFPDRPSGLRAGQTLTLQHGGELGDNFESVDGTLNIEGGSLGEGAGVVGSQVNISGGNVGPFFNAELGSQVNISGGNVGGVFRANYGSEVNISGGNVGGVFIARTGSEVNISSGNVGDHFRAGVGSEVNISGGSFGRFFNAESGSDVELFGGEFKLNGVAFTESTITLGSSDVLTGTLTDGSAFIFSTQGGDNNLDNVTLSPTSLPVIDTTPIVINTAFPDRPSGLRAGQTLSLQHGGELGDNFESVDGTLNIEGGSLGRGAGVVGSEVNISGGNVGRLFAAYAGSQVNISGGNVGSAFGAESGSEVNVFGTEFLLDGMLLDDLVLGEAFIVSDRNVTLSGLLADGTTFDFDLNDSTDSLTDTFSGEATLTVTLVPESQVLLGDCSQDGAVNFLDILPFISILSAGDYLAEADTNEDGVVSFLDISPFIGILSGN